MQLIINIENESIAEKIKGILNVFKNEGIVIQEVKSKIKNEKEGELHSERSYPKVQETDLSDDYLKKHWKELVMTKGDYSNYYKSDQYYEDRAKVYNSKAMI